MTSPESRKQDVVTSLVLYNLPRIEDLFQAGTIRNGDKGNQESRKQLQMHWSKNPLYLVSCAPAVFSKEMNLKNVHWASSQFKPDCSLVRLWEPVTSWEEKHRSKTNIKQTFWIEHCGDSGGLPKSYLKKWNQAAGFHRHDTVCCGTWWKPLQAWSLVFMLFQSLPDCLNALWESTAYCFKCSLLNQQPEHWRQIPNQKRRKQVKMKEIERRL